MSFMDAIRSVFSQYVGFSGRARRSEYWYWVLFVAILSILASVLDASTAGSNNRNYLFSGILNLALLLPNLAVTVRRLHDTSRSGWWILIGLIPLIGSIILLVFNVQDSHPDNQYGPSPKGASAAHPATSV